MSCLQTCRHKSFHPEERPVQFLMQERPDESAIMRSGLEIRSSTRSCPQLHRAAFGAKAFRLLPRPKFLESSDKDRARLLPSVPKSHARFFRPPKDQSAAE